ncbi:hypothetical protein B0A48_02694 [Cryoendolithus antarcticus]|uniref:Uncharacterized protein n=1 Tax=Cryoendolithus antarcticus TaxID=1507870 RepID=A0A1V8TL19_9PEZI|nr:hypothetical protein B0A48_02694 [Cryoendolithus antarcticus]
MKPQGPVGTLPRHTDNDLLPECSQAEVWSRAPKDQQRLDKKDCSVQRFVGVAMGLLMGNDGTDVLVSLASRDGCVEGREQMGGPCGVEDGT